MNKNTTTATAKTATIKNAYAFIQEVTRECIERGFLTNSQHGSRWDALTNNNTGLRLYDVDGNVSLFEFWDNFDMKRGYITLYTSEKLMSLCGVTFQTIELYGGKRLKSRKGDALKVRVKFTDISSLAKLTLRMFANMSHFYEDTADMDALTERLKESGYELVDVNAVKAVA